MANTNMALDDLRMYSWACFGHLCAEHDVTVGYEGSGATRTWDPDRAIEKVHGDSAYADTLATKGEQAALDEVIAKEYEPVYVERGKA